ncbi:unnamed protein product [Brachionus calyciflorus]|uniref:Uncharacterized protein n=1 Tax=Brachionus calyciflorus TaxID=104777 RepID=A0A814R4D3_9BILA|nr:unnamed protein product [Brachionus calyciflorus]
MTMLTIQLDQLFGRCVLFYSFVNPNPKDDLDVIDQPGSRKKREAEQSQKYYTVSKPTDGNSDTLYLSVKGYDNSNSFEMKVLDKVIVNGQPPVYGSFCLISFIILMSILNI